MIVYVLTVTEFDETEPPNRCTWVTDAATRAMSLAQAHSNQLYEERDYDVEPPFLIWDAVAQDEWVRKDGALDVEFRITQCTVIGVA